jgi:hypothetical protein
MRRLAISVLCFLALALAAATKSYAGLVVVDPDAYTNGTDISNGYVGVTLEAYGSFVVGSEVYALDDGVYSTHPHCFAYIDSEFGPYGGWGEAGGGPQDPDELFRAIFDVPTSFVSINVVEGEGQETATVGFLRAYDASDNLLAEVLSGGLYNGAGETLTISRPGADIAYVDAGAPASSPYIHLDRLAFDDQAERVIPEPATMTLLGLGALALVRRRR